MEEHEKIGEKGQCLFNGFKPGDIPAEVQNLPEVKVLKIVWTQQFRAEAVANGVYGFEKKYYRHIKIHIPPDSEARYSRKCHSEWVGGKVQ